MASKLIGIIGPSGEGKSTSIRTLDPKETLIIGVASKELPFKGAEKLYNKESKNYVEISTSTEICSIMKNVSEKAAHIKNIVIDDSTYVMSFEFMKRATETGYTKFSQIGQNFLTILQTARQLRSDMKTFIISHSEPLTDGEDIISYKIKTIGKILDSNINLEGLFTVVLYTHTEEDKDGNISYNFVTNKWKKFPAKSPMGMFDKTLIPNDLQLVSETVDKYYN